MVVTTIVIDNLVYVVALQCVHYLLVLCMFHRIWDIDVCVSRCVDCCIINVSAWLHSADSA